MTDSSPPNLRDKARQYMADGWQTAPPEAFERFHATRRKRAGKIRALLQQAGALDRPQPLLLDIGCSTGQVLSAVAGTDTYGIGVDLDASAGFATRPGLAFAVADGERLPLRDDCIDAVICNHIYEHTARPDLLIAEIHRVLRPGGWCYFAGPSRWELVEPHYHLPFLSWLPRPLADRYMRLSGRGQHYLERPLTRGQLLRLLAVFEVHCCMDRLLADPVAYDAEDLLPPGSLKQRLARAVHATFPAAMPGFIFLCRKGTASAAG